MSRNIASFSVADIQPSRYDQGGYGQAEDRALVREREKAEEEITKSAMIALLLRKKKEKELRAATRVPMVPAIPVGPPAPPEAPVPARIDIQININQIVNVVLDPTFNIHNNLILEDITHVSPDSDYQPKLSRDRGQYGRREGQQRGGVARSTVDITKPVYVGERKEGFVDIYRPFKNVMSDFTTDELITNQQTQANFLRLVIRTMEEVIEKYRVQKGLNRDDIVFIYKGGNVLKAIYLDFMYENPGLLSDLIYESFQPYFGKSDADFEIYINPHLNANKWRDTYRDMKELSYIVLDQIRMKIIKDKTTYFDYDKYSFNYQEAVLGKYLDKLNQERENIEKQIREDISTREKCGITGEDPDEDAKALLARNIFIGLRYGRATVKKVCPNCDVKPIKCKSLPKNERANCLWDQRQPCPPAGVCPECNCDPSIVNLQEIRRNKIYSEDRKPVVVKDGEEDVQEEIVYRSRFQEIYERGAAGETRSDIVIENFVDPNEPDETKLAIYLKPLLRIEDSTTLQELDPRVKNIDLDQIKTAQMRAEQLYQEREEAQKRGDQHTVNEKTFEIIVNNKKISQAYVDQGLLQGKSEIYLSVNDTVAFTPTPNVLTKFCLVRMKAHLSAFYKADVRKPDEGPRYKYGLLNFPGELIDISIPHRISTEIRNFYSGQDGKPFTKKWDTYIYEPRYATGLKKEELREQQEQSFSFRSYSRQYFVNDIHQIFFYENIYLWTARKFKKRLWRLMFLYLIEILQLQTNISAVQELMSLLINIFESLRAEIKEEGLKLAELTSIREKLQSTESYFGQIMGNDPELGSSIESKFGLSFFIRRLIKYFGGTEDKYDLPISHLMDLKDVQPDEIRDFKEYPLEFFTGKQNINFDEGRQYQTNILKKVPLCATDPDVIAKDIKQFKEFVEEMLTILNLINGSNGILPTWRNYIETSEKFGTIFGNRLLTINNL